MSKKEEELDLRKMISEYLNKQAHIDEYMNYLFELKKRKKDNKEK